ncbi:MAG: PP0621 family protein [Gammaproteobacteria bacterium]
MFRLLLIIAVVFTVISLLHRAISNKMTYNRQHHNRPPSKMVRCGYCRLYLTQDEAIREDDQFYCCPEHKHLAMISKDE